MDLLTSIALVVLFIAALEFVASDRFSRAVSRWLEDVRARLGRPVPVGLHRVDGQVGIGFGRDDTTLILRLRMADPVTERTTTYRGRTHSSTRFTVDGYEASPDALLEAYDDEAGPLELQVDEPGRIGAIGVSSMRR